MKNSQLYTLIAFLWLMTGVIAASNFTTFLVCIILSFVAMIMSVLMTLKENDLWFWKMKSKRLRQEMVKTAFEAIYARLESIENQIILGNSKSTKPTRSKK